MLHPLSPSVAVHRTPPQHRLYSAVHSSYIGDRMPKALLASLLCALLPLIPHPHARAAAPPSPESTPLPLRMLVPGFTIRELPIDLTNLNNLEYPPDGRLFAVGYDGRVQILTDTDN